MFKFQTLIVLSQDADAACLSGSATAAFTLLVCPIGGGNSTEVSRLQTLRVKSSEPEIMRPSGKTATAWPQSQHDL
ncbi:hypothetical protein CYANOKiyG1_05320 [Okeania sp. KiyG1]|nr:hypothetical protein CYANOKiyG1_05320 [Okeania sp. KiyG1]